MIRCPGCTSQVPDDQRFCGRCGTDVNVEPDMTQTSLNGHAHQPPPSGTMGSAVPSSSTGVGRLSSSGDSIADSRFLPGAMLDGRYRIIGMLGKGGMGEVYRADDLKLGQAVALKFLPPSLEQDQGRLQRFLNEVKIARQVSHPNVCRVYDVGEVGGQHFISMEFVDGEDLSTLLRRIGRLSSDKAVQIARQICAGLGAAHAKGIVHRDLKPANVMLDGQGQVRLTDFGLAGLAVGFEGAEIRVGTPAYMSPEQLQGTEVTLKSDIYSLGLVLYELFTGKAAFNAPTLAELVRQQQETRPSTPSTVVPGMDPAAERVILRCMEKDPAQRPASALAVAAALPGGDPLAAALEAGETPSPEMVAAAGVDGGLRPGIGMLLLLGIVFGVAGIVMLSGKFGILRQVDLPRPPVALAVDAREMIERLGYAETPADRAFGFGLDTEYLQHVNDEDDSPTRWDNLGTIRPGPIAFWYRESPRPLLSVRAAGPASYNNPPMSISGMAQMQLDPRGRLVEFLAIPPQRVEPAETIEAANWDLLLSEAGLNTADLQTVDSTWNPLVDCDERIAWEGTYPDQPDPVVRVEAGAYRGKPVYFQVLSPWNKPTRMQPNSQDTASVVATWIVFSVLGLILAGGIFLARRNLNRNRGDRRGAFRMAMYLVAVMIGIWILSDHVRTLGEVVSFIRAVQAALFVGGMAWIFYLAIEPYVRRLWPHALITWSRLLSGRIRDPLLGRDLLVGSFTGVAIILFLLLTRLAPGWLGQAPPQPFAGAVATLASMRALGSVVLGLQINAIIASIVLFFMLFLLRWAFKREWIAVTIVIALMTVIQGLQNNNWVGWIFAAAAWILIMLVITRLGLLTGVITFVTANTLTNLPLSLDFSTWYVGRAWFGPVLVIAIAAYGFYISLGGRAVFRDSLFE